MTEKSISKAALISSLPPVWPEDPFPVIQRAVAMSATKLVILDDDPTGTQTVHGLPVLTTWSPDRLQKELHSDGPGFFILTNSRSLPVSQAISLSRDIGANLRKAVKEAGVEVQVISRSDSTLRGHFPEEVDAMMDAMGTPDLPRILAPCFFEGGRITAGDIHYVAEKEELIPAGLTPYAKDAAFGYKHSNLRRWVEEKTGGRVPQKDVFSISLKDLREKGSESVSGILRALPPKSCCIVNATTYRDMEVFVAGLLDAERRGFRFVFRSAASIVRIRAGISPKELLGRSALTVDTQNGGLFVVGSYVPKTTAQVEALTSLKMVETVEVQVPDLLDNSRQAAAVSTAAEKVNRTLARGQDTVLMTSRELVTDADAGKSLDIARRVSESLITLVQGIDCQPRYMVVKGGITSSDVATRGLEVKRAMVMGQVLPGVPVWRLGEETRWPGMAYIVFPGNVGDDNALAVVRERLAK